MNNWNEKAGLIWDIAELLRGDYQRREYSYVILPFTVLRRLDQAMAPYRAVVRATYQKYVGRLDNMADILEESAGDSKVYNTSQYDWQSLLADPDNLDENLRNYLLGFSDHVKDIVEKFDFQRQIPRLKGDGEESLLYKVMQRFGNISLHPDAVSNLDMGYIFEELIRKFNEQDNETAGEHFTPREVIQLMVALLFTGQEQRLHDDKGRVYKIYDPACGTGGMLSVANHYIFQHYPHLNQNFIHLFGQELNPVSYAVAKADMLLKGEAPENIRLGNSFSDDGYSRERFDFMLSNPPYGVDWKKVEGTIRHEYVTRGEDGRFGAGLPRVSDGSLLFLQHMISKMRPVSEGGSRIAIIFNGSPLFTGDAGSGESEIRRWIIDNDWLEGIVALPDQLFYNTGINTYIWIVTNAKAPERRGKVQLINAAVKEKEEKNKRIAENRNDLFYRKMRRSLGNKRHEFTDDHINAIAARYQNRVVDKVSDIYPNHFFGYRKVKIERPLRLNFIASEERIERVKSEGAFQKLTESKKASAGERKADQEAGRLAQEAILLALKSMPQELYKERIPFANLLEKALQNKVKLTKSLRKGVLAALSERDKGATACYVDDDPKKGFESDSQLSDYESIPLYAPEMDEDAKGIEGVHLGFPIPKSMPKVRLPESVYSYFRNEVLPHVPDAFINPTFTDEQDQRIGNVGYEISFNRYFYEYEAPRSLDEIEADIKGLEKNILKLLQEINADPLAGA